MLKNILTSFDDRRDLFIGADEKASIAFAVENWIHMAERAVQQRGRFVVALSGGSTPKAIYQALVQIPFSHWSRVWLFWSDERSVPPEHAESNYRMAMESFSKVNIPPFQIFRMEAEKDIEQKALDYEQKIKHVLGRAPFDLIMLGIGEDGHTASLFPKTAALQEEDALVVSNAVPQLKTQRMTLTFPCINQASRIVLYALGSSKQKIVSEVLQAPILSPFPASRIGTAEQKALWVLDAHSAKLIV